MAKQLSGKRYAQAIFELAEEQEKLEAWQSDLQTAVAVLEDLQYRQFLQHAKAPRQAKLESLNTVLRDIDPMVRNLVALLTTRGAVELVPSVADEYNRLLDIRLERQRVDVISATPLTPDEVEQIRQFVAGMIDKEIIVSSRVDESIIGGVIIQVGDKLLDGSVRSRLENLRKRLVTEAVGR